MIPVKVIPHGDKWRVVTESMENPIGPRLWVPSRPTACHLPTMCLRKSRML